MKKIRAEKIIRLIISILEDKHPNTFWRSNEMESGVYTEELVSFLSDLEKECEEKPTTAEGLEEEIKRFQKEVWDYDTTLSDVARHFAQWQKEQDKVKNTEIARRAINGYKEEMLKEAVETWMLEGSMFEPEFIKRKVIIIKED